MIRYSQCTGQLSMTASFETRVDYAKKTINGNVRLKEKHIECLMFPCLEIVRRNFEFPTISQINRRDFRAQNHVKLLFRKPPNVQNYNNTHSEIIEHVFADNRTWNHARQFRLKKYRGISTHSGYRAVLIYRVLPEVTEYILL